MKKTIAWLIILMVLMTSTVFAETTRLKPIANKDRLVAIELSSRITTNNQEIRTLNQETKTNIKAVQKRIRVIIENKEDITVEELENLKVFLEDIKEAQVAIKDTLGRITAYREDIQVLRENRDFNGLKEIYREILRIQETRINNLERINMRMTSFLNNRK